MPASSRLYQMTKSVTFPEEDLDAITSAIEEQEEVTGERILPEELVHHTEEPVEALSMSVVPGAEAKRARRRESWGNISGLPGGSRRVRPAAAMRGLEQSWTNRALEPDHAVIGAARFPVGCPRWDR